MFKLLDCNNFWSPSGGGVRRYHLEKIEYYKDRMDVEYVFVMHDKETFTEQIGENAFIEHLRVPKVMGNWEYRYLVKSGPIEPIILKHNPDVIEVGSPYFMPGIIHKIVRKNRLDSKVFGFWHADFPITYVGRFLTGSPLQSMGEKVAWRKARKDYNRMDGVLVSSQTIMDRMQENGMHNLNFAPLGVNEELFHPDQRNDALREKLQAGDSNRLILFFPHRFSKEKGLHILLKAYEILTRIMDVAPALVLAGTGPYEHLVTEAVAKYDHVHFQGFIRSKEEMAEYYASSDLGFALSSWETFGLSLVEALSAGLPLISAGAGAAREHIEKSDAGFILEEVKPQSLADAVVTFSKMEDLKLREKARAYASTLSWENCFDRQLDIYSSAISNKK